MSEKILFPRLFKGIAMFTPGGTLVYAIDLNKQDYWHLNLCAALQEIFRLPEPPHFLVPAYTATIDLWLDPRTKQLRTSTEIYRPVRHHQALLNAVFGTANLTWQVAPWEESLCDPMVIETYHHQFPQLWEDRDLIVRWERLEGSTSYAYSQSLGIGLAKVEQNSTLALETPLPARESLKERGMTGVNTNTYPRQPLSWYGENLMVNMNQEDFANPEQSVPSSSANTDNNSASSSETSGIKGLGNAHTTRLGNAHTTRLGNAHAKRSPQWLDLAYTQNLSADPGTDKNFSPELASTTLSTSLEESTETESQSQQQPTQGYVLRLFVSQNSEATEQTLKSLHELLENSIRHPYTLKVIDVFKHPDQAEANQVSATPTLVRIWPLPIRRLVGDLSDVERVLRILVTPSED